MEHKGPQVHPVLLDPLAQLRRCPVRLALAALLDPLVPRQPYRGLRGHLVPRALLVQPQPYLDLQAPAVLPVLLAHLDRLGLRDRLVRLVVAEPLLQDR
jgi:hypothetical protein